MKTILLDRTKWDLVKDLSGNIALASEPYALAQDAASAIRLFSGELWYDTTRGVPYWRQILGKWPSLAYVKARLVDAALTVPGVTGARCFVSSFRDRHITGQVQVTDKTGTVTVAAF